MHNVPIAYTLTALSKHPQNRPIKVDFALLERSEIEHDPIGTLPAIARHKKYSANHKALKLNRLADFHYIIFSTSSHKA